ncbi:PREDICTED: EKC/KEOPS complex subunit LAGE3-like [Chinchilla lanigera]|uniref:EKC/KEOPS complex subunit LAGE3-like n=1 Tax=Chinchilla lanigera TaxID=34839 RepID=UPI000697EC2D|nr:PREDICTED: EKC/KEOPS complex subunit LAGE3-like [Chinchilla lanigera]
MQARAGGSGVAGGQEDGQGGSRNLNGQGGAGNQGGVGSAGVSGDYDGTNATAVSPIALVPNSRGQIVLMSTCPAMRRHALTLRVLFGSPIEAEVAQGFLAIFDEYPSIDRELTMTGSILVVTWIVEDPGQLQPVLISFLKDLILIFNIMNFLGPPSSFVS